MATKFITVSIEIMHDKNLNQSQKFILAEIEQLSNLESGCFASNQHFAELIGITKENVSRNINDLKDMGYIDIKIENGSRNHNRMITLTKTTRPPYQNDKTPLSKRQETIDNKHINIQSNIKKINKKENDINLDLYPKLNIEAFNQWCAYKGNRYSKQGKTLSINKLTAYDKATQQEMVNNSIMNNYAGLFEIKSKPKQKETQRELIDRVVSSMGYKIEEKQDDVIDVEFDVGDIF